MLPMKMAGAFCAMVVMNVHVSCQIPGVDTVKSGFECAALDGELTTKGAANEHDCGKYLTLEKTCKDALDAQELEKKFKEMRDLHYKEKCGCGHTIMNIALGFACLLIALFHNTGVYSTRSV